MIDGTVVTRPRTMKEDIKQNKPFKTRGQEALLGLIRAADDLKRHIAELLEPYGITSQQYNVLRILRGAGDEGLPTLMIGERMIERTPGVTRLIDRMEKHGWVTRKRCTEDRRRVWCRITDAGLSLLTTLEPVIESVDGLSAVLDEHDLVRLIEYLDELRAAFNE